MISSFIFILYNMKKLFSLLVWLLMFWTWAYAQDIQLKPGWTAVSTPVVLESLSFSNGWEWISFVTVNGWNWKTVPATVNNVKPLNGFMVYNTNSSTVTLTLDYKDNPTPAESLLQKTLNPWWNLVWVVWTEDPFSDIDAKVYVDPNGPWKWKASKTISNAKLGWAYFVFVNNQSIYLWVSNNLQTDVQEEEPDPIVPDPVVPDPVEPDPDLIVVATNLQIKKDDWPILKLGSSIWELVKFYVKGESWKITGFTLKSNSTSNPIDKTKMSIKIWSYEVSQDNISISNWDIIVSWIEANVDWSWMLVEVKYNEWLTNVVTNYTLTNINNDVFDINIKYKYVKSYAYPWRHFELNPGYTSYNFVASKDKDQLDITGFVLFVWNKALNEPVSYNSLWWILTIPNWDEPQIIDGIWFGCPTWVTSIDQCNDKILKSEYPSIFKTNQWDLQVF